MRMSRLVHPSIAAQIALLASLALMIWVIACTPWSTFQLGSRICSWKPYWSAMRCMPAAKPAAMSMPIEIDTNTTFLPFMLS